MSVEPQADGLTTEDRADLLRAFMVGRPDGIPEDELLRLYRWAWDATLTAALMRLLHEGRLAAHWPEGEAEIRFVRLDD